MATTSAPPKLDPKDVLGLDHLLGDEEKMLRDSVRRWVGDRVLPEIGSWFEEGILPRELAKEVGDLGLLGMHLEGYGCAGASATAYGVACRELEFGDSGLRSLVSVQGSLAMFPIWRYGSDEQKDLYLPKMTSGQWTGTMCLTEPHCGTDLEMLRSKAEPQPDGSYRVTRATFDNTQTNGILVSPDQRTLYVAESGYKRGVNRELRAYPIREDGSLGSYDTLFSWGEDARGVHRGIDGMCHDAEGNIIATAGYEVSGAGPMLYVFSL